MRKGLGALALLAWVCGAPLVSAEEWGGITPGVSTLESVAERYGNPSSESRQKLEGYGTIQWVYEKEKAPSGMVRMTVDFGLLTPKGYEPKVVRSLLLEPRPGVFLRPHILAGWGSPNKVGTESEQMVFFYLSGLMVHFDKRSDSAVSMLFTIPQPETPPPAK